MRSSRATTILALAVIALLPTVGGGRIHAADEGFDWKRSTPESQGIDSDMLLRSIRRIRDENLDVRSLILIRDGHVVLELYVHPYDRNTIHNVKSVSKSILSALVGIALREEILKSTDQKVREFFPAHFPEDPSDARNRITLWHLLTMTSGLDLDENGPKMQRVFESDDWIRQTFRTEMAATPGERFVNSTPLTHAMVGVLTEAGGKTVLELADEHLFGPLGFGELQWTRGPKGYYFGGAELFLRPRDMAKFGLLYLHDGRWGERQVVPAEWVGESTRNRLPEASQNSYGYWWWVDPDGGGFAARGWGGQGISVRRDLRLVAAGTAGDPTATDRLFRDFDPSTIRDEPLPPNPDAVAALDALVRELEDPEPTRVPPLPELALAVSGRTWILDDNPRGFRSFTFRFEAGSSIATIVTAREDVVIETEIGLDGLYRLTETGTNGPMPDRNKLALRGGWTSDDTFVVRSNRVGDPVSATWTFRFDEDALKAEAEVHPIGQRFELRGRAAPPTPSE